MAIGDHKVLPAVVVDVHEMCAEADEVLSQGGKTHGPGFVIEPKEEIELGGAFYELIPNREVSEFKDAVGQLMSYSGPDYVTP